MVNIVKKDRNPKYWSNKHILVLCNKIKYFSIYFKYDNFKILFVSKKSIKIFLKTHYIFNHLYMKYRIEKDTIGEVKVPENVYWGAN